MNRDFGGAAESSEGLPGNQAKRCRVNDPHLAFVAETEVVMPHARWRNPDLMARWKATHPLAVGEMGAAVSAWIARERNRVSGQELKGEGGKLHLGPGECLDEIQSIRAIGRALPIQVSF